MSRIASVCRHECQGAHLITAAEVEASGTQTHHTARHDDAGSSNASDDVQCGWGRLILQEQTFRNLRSGDLRHLLSNLDTQHQLSCNADCASLALISRLLSIVPRQGHRGLPVAEYPSLQPVH